MRTNLRKPSLIPALHLALLLALPALGAEKETVDTVLAKYVKAIGGKEAWNKVETRFIKAEISDVSGSTTSGWSLYAKAPNKRFTRVDSSPWGVLLDGFDGTTAWSKNQNGVQTKTADELSRSAKEADFCREVRLKELYPDLAMKGTETLDGEEVQVLESQPSPNTRERFSFNAKSGFLVRRQSEYKNPQGNDTRLDTRYSDYRAVAGLQYPHLQQLKFVVAGQEIEIVMKVKQIKHNEKFDDSCFRKPAN